MLDEDWFCAVSQQEYEKKSQEGALRFVTCRPMSIINTQKKEEN